MSKAVNPILLEIFCNRFSSIAEEMGMILYKTAFSPNIKERRDFSCGIFAKDGELTAQAAHIPVHLGSMPLSVAAAIKNIDFSEGDMVILNDPFAGGTHLPDITIIAPVFFSKGDTPDFFVANRAHHADVGGSFSGSMPLASSIFAEGLIIPAVKIMKKGKLDEELMRLILRNVRTPLERQGDLQAQFNANYKGIQRLKELIATYGLNKTLFYSEAACDYTAKLLEELFKKIDSVKASFTDYLDDDGYGNFDLKINLELTIKDNQAILDFSKSDPQTSGSINAVYAITLSSVLYCFRCLLGKSTPTNGGLLRPLQIISPRGSLLNAEFPASVAGGNVETSQRIVDVIFGALSKILADKVPAASQGTMNNIALGGYDRSRQQPFTYYETIAGGMGASSKFEGATGVHSHMTNTLNTPIEALEQAYPLLVERYEIRQNSGGKGQKKGGDGLIREIKLLEDADVTILSERRLRAPYGLQGGECGQRGNNLIKKGTQLLSQPGKFNISLKASDIIRIETPGGGGFGKVEKGG